MAQPDNIKNLYEALKNEYDLGSEQDFRTSMSDKNNRQTLYNTIKDEYDLGTQDDFEKSLGYSDTPKQQSTPKPQPATPKASQSIATNGTAATTNGTANNKGQTKQEDKEPGLLQTAFGGGKVAGAEAHKTDGSGLVGLLLNAVAKQQPTDGNTEEEKRAIDAAKYQQLMNEQNRKIADYGKEYNNTLQGIKNSNPETRTPTLNYEVRVAENSPQEFADKGTFIGKDGKPHKKLIGTSSPEDISQEAYAVSNEFSKKKADEIARTIVSHMPEHISTDDGDNEELRNAYYNKDAVDMIAEAAGAMGMTYHDFFNVYVRPRISNAVYERYRGRKVTAPGLSGDLGEVAKQGKSYDERWMNDDERAMYDSLWGLFHNDLNKLQAEGEKASLAEWKKNHEGTQLPGYTGVADMGVGAMSERAKNYAADPQKAVDDVLNKLYAENGGKNGGATEDMDRQAIGNLLYRNMMKYLIDQRVPKSKWGYVLQGFADSDVGQLFQALTKTSYERHLDNLANEKYTSNLNGFTGLLAEGGHEATKFLGDAWEYWLGGKAGKAVTGAIRRRAISGLTADLTARGIAEAEAKNIAIRIANARTKSAAEKAFLHAASGSATLGSAQAISGGLRQGLTPAAGQKKAEIQERRANGETISKEQEDKEIAQANAKAHSVGAIAKSAGGSGLSGAVMGATFGAGSFAGDATSKYLGKYFGDVTSAAGGYLAKLNTNAAAATALGQAEGALTGQQPEGSTGKQFVSNLVNFAMLDGMNYAPKVLGGHPIRDFRQWKEYERAMGISEEDQDRMRNLGYGDLMDTVDGLVSDRLRTGNPNAGTELSTQRQAESPRETKVNRGMLNMLADPRIPEELKRKYYVVVTGDNSKQLSPIVGSEVTTDEDGNTYLVTYNKNGNVVSDRQYHNEQAAKEAQMKIGHEQDENLTEALQQNVFAKDADAVMEEAYNAAAEAYKNGGKLNNGQRTLIYLYQNKAQLTKAIQAMASGEPLSDADKKLVNLYNAVKNTLYSMDGNIPRIVNDVEEDNGLGTGGLQKARKGHTEKEAKRIVKETGEEIVHVGGDVWRTMSEDQAVKDYQQRLYDYINDIHEGTGENVAEPKGLPGRTEQPTDTQEQTTQPEQTTGEGDVALQRPTQPEEPTHPEQPTNEVGDVAQQRPTQQETEPGTEQPAQPTDTQQPSQPSGTAQPTGRYSVNSDAVSQLTPEQMKNLSGYVIGFVNEHPDVVSNDIQGKAEATAKYLNGETNDRDYLIALGYATGEENTFLDSPTTTQEEIAQEAQQNAQKYSSLLNDSEAVQQPTEGNAQQPQGEEQPAQPEGQSQVQTVREQGRQRGLSVESDETQLAQIQEDSDLANKRFNNAFAGNQLGEFRNGLIQAVEDDDEDAIQALFDKYGDRLSTEQKEAAMGLVENGAVQNGIEESITNQTMQYQDARKQELDGISDSTGNITEITLQDGSTVYYKSGDITNQYGGIIVVDGNGDTQQIPVNSIAQVGQPTSAKAILDEDTNNFAQGLQNGYQAMASGASMLPGQETTINVGGQNFHATMETELQDGSVQLRLDDGSPLVLTPDQLQQARKAARDANTTQQLADAEQQRQMKEREDRYNKGVVGYGDGNPDFSAPKTDARTAAELMHEQDKQAGKASKERLSDIQSERDKLNDQIRNAQWEMSRQQRWLDLNGDTYSEEERASKQAIIDGYQQQINEWQQRVRKLGEVRNAYMSNEERRQFQSNRRKTMDDVRKNTELGIKNGGLTPTTPQNGGQPQVEVPDAKTLLEKYPTQADANAALSEMRDNVMKSYRDGSANVLSDVRAQIRDYEEGMSDLGNDELQNLYLQQAGAQQAEEAAMQQVQKIKNLQGQLSNIYKDRNKAALNEMSPRERRAAILSGAKTPEELQQKAHEAYNGSELESRLDDTEPETLEEYVSQNMPTNLNWEGTGSGITQKRGLKQELGLSRGIGRNFDSNGINSLLAPKGQGISVDEAAHALWEGRPSQFEGATTQDMRNTLLDLIANSPNARYIKSLTIRNRINEVEGYELAQEEQEQWLQQQADEEAKARQAEIDTYNDYLDDTVKDTVPSDEVSDYLSGLYADEIAKAMEEAEEQEEAWREYEKEKADAEKAAQEKQSLEPNNNDNGTEREDGTGEGVDSEPKQPTVHAGNGEGEAPLRAEETHKPNAEVQHNAQGRTNAGTETSQTGSGTTNGGISLPTVKKGKAVAQQRRTQHVDFARETEQQSKAFEESIPKMTDEELLGYIAQDSPDATKQYHPALGDEYDYRHRDEEQDYYNFYEPMLDEEYSKGGREAVKETYNKAWQDWVNGGYASAEDRTRLSAQINACEDWLTAHDKDNQLGATDTPEKVDVERQKVNTEPTEAQKEAGNYRKGHVKVDGYDISIENPKGSVREKKDANGKVLWRTPMHYDYGYILGTKGTDGDHIDVYLSDTPTEGNVYVVDQIDQKTGDFDEHKVMYGFPSMDAARDAYKSQYEDGWKVGTITEVSREDFKKWVESSKRKTKPFSEYKSVKDAAALRQHTQPDTTPTLKEPAVYKNNLAGGDAYANIEGNPKSGYVVRYYDNLNDAKAKNAIAIGVENMTSEQLADHLQKGDFAPTEKSQEFADMLGTSPDKLREILNDTNKHNNYNTYGRLDEFKKGVDKEKGFALVDKIYGKQNKKYMYNILLGKMIWEFLDNKGQTLPTKKEKGETNNNPLVKAAQETGHLVIGGVSGSTDSANEPKPIGHGDFGPIYNQFEGKPKEAFEFITKKKSGDLLNVFHRNDTGGIDLVWGDEKGGLNHIIVKHVGKGKDFETEADAFSKIEDVLKNGKLIQSGQLRYVVSEDGYRVAIRKDYNGNKKNWIVSAVDYNRSKEEKGITTNPTSASHGASGSELAAPGNSTGKDSKNNPNAQENGEKNDVVDKVIAESERRKALAKRIDDIGVDYNVNWPYNLTTQTAKEKNWVITKRQKAGKRSTGAIVKVGFSGNDLYMRTKEGVKRVNNAKDYTAAEIAVRVNLGIGVTTDEARLLGDAILELYQQNDMPISEQPILRPLISSKKKKATSAGQQLDLFGNFAEQQPSKSDDNKAIETTANKNENQLKGKKNDLRGTDELRTKGLQADDHHEGEHTPRQSETTAQRREAADRKGEAESVRRVRSSDDERLRPGNELEPEEDPEATPEHPLNRRNNHAERGVDYAPKGVDDRIEANIKAIELSQQITEEGRAATPDEMKVLRKYSGWGGLGKAFKEKQHPWETDGIAEQLKSLLGDEGYEQAVMSRNSAYFTPANVIDTMWDIARALGFKGGNVLEGSAGIGNIIGLMPQDMSDRSHIQAVEIDSTSGNILSLLYPEAKTDIQGFEKTKIRNGSVDLAITNVPFVTGLHVNDTTGDGDLSRKFGDIHDFCIAKNIRKLRPGGIGIFITSNGTLDKSQKLRDWIVSDGDSDVVGAFRMNNSTFGGTSATSDIIVVRRRVNGEKVPNAIDVSNIGVERVAKVKTTDRRGNYEEKPYSIDYNQYFIDHPENMGGKMYLAGEKGDTYRPTSKGLFPVPGISQTERMKEWVKKLAESAKEWKKARPARKTHGKIEEEQKVYEALGDDVHEGSMLVDSKGNLCVATYGEAVPIKVNKNKVKGHTKIECFNAYSRIKDAVKAVLDYQTKHEDNEGLEPLIKKLNQAYDSFVATYGHLNKNVAIAFLKRDMDYSSIAALETFKDSNDKNGKRVTTYGKTDIFKQRVIEKETEPKPTNIKDGVITSIYQYGKLDLNYIAEQLGKTPDEVKKEIISSGLGFEDPVTRETQVSYEYLSGNVREKLHQAEEANEDGQYNNNIQALKKVIPMDIPSHLIDFTLGSSWLDSTLYDEYIKDRTGIDVMTSNVNGTWAANVPKYGLNTEKNRTFGVHSSMFNTDVYGTDLIIAAMKNKTIGVSRVEKHADGKSETVTDKDATTMCAQRIEEIRDDFKDWARGKMQNDPDLAKKYEDRYNEQFNNYVPREIPDNFLPEYFAGANHAIHLRAHQAKAAIRATMQNVLFAHEVGSGKTFTLITTAMEMRRLGTAKKPLIVVQNATVGQFVASAKFLYPNAKILTIDDKEHDEQGRRAFYAKVKYNDWDMIVIPQSVLEKIPDSDERQLKFIQDKVAEKEAVLAQMQNSDMDDPFVTRRAEKELADLQDQMQEITQHMNEHKKDRDSKKAAVARQNAAVKAQEMLNRKVDDVENFDDMGIDAFLVDEAHEYKHLGFATAMQRGVKGIDPSYSKKCAGVYLKCQSVMEKSGGKNVVFATGTPISNTAAEIWTFMKYLMPEDRMKSYGIYYFDDFVRNFGTLSQMPEFNTSGQFVEVNRFRGYSNLPELVRIWSGVADTVLSSEVGDLSAKIPKMKSGKAIDIYLPQSRSLRAVMKYVREQLKKFNEMSGKEKRANSAIPLKMYNIAKQAAVDPRLVSSNSPDEPNSKTNAAVKETLKSLDESKAYRGTIAIFADNYQNSDGKFNLFDDIKKKLVAKGVPDNEIVIIRPSMKVNKKTEIFDKLNSGEVRVVMGTTFTLGTGANFQERLYTLINIDAPNRPMDYTQRLGRILRQGNLHREWGIPVKVIRFGVEDSLDVTAYQRLKTKGAIADSIMHGKQLMKNSMENRTIEEEEDQFGDTVAQLSGSQYAMLKQGAEREVKKWENKKKQWEADQVYIHAAKPRLKGQIEEAQKRADYNAKGLQYLEEHKGDGTIIAGKQRFKNVEAMGDFIKNFNKTVKANEDEMRKSRDQSPRAISVNLSIDGVNFKITMKLDRDMMSNGRSLFEKISRDMRYYCPQLTGDWGVPVKGDLLRNALEDITQNVMTGNDLRERKESTENEVTRLKGELEQVVSREGKPFQYGDKLADAQKKLADFTEKMKAELEEKQKKYAAIDAEVEEVTPDDVNTDGGDTEQSEDMLRDAEVFEDGERLPIIWREDGISVEGLNNEYDNAGQLLDAFREKYPDYISAIYDEDGQELPPSKAYSRQSDYKHPVLVVEPLQKYLAGYTDRRAVAMRQHTQRQQERAQETVKSWAKKLNLGDKVTVITDDSKLNGKKAKAKGWFDTKSGKIAIVLPKHTSIDDVVRTMLHEGVAHYGLRKLFGDKFDTFLDNVWNNASVDVKRRLEKLAIKYDGNQRKATEEYLSGLAEDTDFDRAMKSGWWGKIKNFFISMLAKAGIRLKHSLTDNDLRYILWRSYQNMVHPGEYRDGIKETTEDVEPIDGTDPIDVIEGRTRVAEPMPRRGSAAREHTEAEKQQMQRAAEEAGEALGGVKVSVERNGHDGIKGSYNTEDDTVHVNLDEADDAEDIQATVSHEVLGHEGLKALFGSNKGVDAFGEFIYDNAGKALRRKIVERAAEEGYEWDDPLRYSKAAQEVFSDIASEGPANAAEFSLWRKVKHYVIKAAKALGLHIKGLVNDHDLRYYVLKTGKAVKNWVKMSDAERAEAAEPGRVMYARRGKPKQKKGESMAHYIQRLREYEMWKNAEQKAREANDPLPEREDFEKKAQEEFNKAMDDWRKQTGIEEGTEQPEAFPKRKDGETPQEYAIRVADYESELDKWKTAPNVFDYLKKGEDAYRQAYEDWKVRYDIQEMEDVDEKLYGEPKPSEPENEEDHYKKMEIDAAVDKDLGDAVGVDTGVDGARRQAKLAVIERRKNLESASAEDAIFIHDLCKDIDNLAKELGMSKERLRSDLITIIEEPRQQKEGDDEVERWVDILNKMRAFQDAHTSITADGVKAARQELSDLAHEIHNHGYKPSTGEGRQAVHDAAVRLADKLNEFYKDNPSYNKLFGDDIMQVGKYIGYLDMAASMADESSALSDDPRVKAIVDRIHDWYDNFFHVIEDAGLRGDAGYIAEGYINHIWDKDKSDAEAWNTYVENFQRTKSANMRHRTVDTYLDGIKVGLVPKFNDIAQIMSYYSRQNNEAIANKKFLDDLSFLTVSETNKDGEVTRILPVLNSHKPGKFDEERYQMYHVPGVGDVWVLKDVAGRFASIFGTMRTQDIPNWLSNIGKGYDLLGSTMKKIQLSISGFHAFALTEVAIAQMGPINGARWAAKSLPIELKPLLMLKELFKGTLIDSIKNGTIPAYARPEDFKFAASHLVQLGATQDYAAADVNMITEKFRNYVKGLRNDETFMKKLAGNAINPFAVALDWVNKGTDKLLWNYLHDGLKIACFKHFAEQIDRKVEKEGLTAKQRDRLLDEAGQYVNDTFGGQYWELLNVSPATLKWLRRAFLSSDWLISTQRHFFANFGFGSLYDPRTFAQYLSDQLPGGKKRKAKREQAQQGDNAEPYITKPEDDGDIYRQFRSKAARLCYILGVGVYFYTMMNGNNAIMRAWDKEKEKEKADEIRKTNPEYKSPYELAYPDGMKWYDYTMFGNALGQQTHLFLGRYADGSEMYVRWGKQFREFPEMFIGSKGLDFPAPMIQRLMGKANPVIGLLRDNLGALGIWGFENQNDIADIQAKYGKTIGLLAMNARHFFPYSLPTQADKEFKMMDVFMPSQKGFTRYKTVDYFKDFIKSGDMEGVTRTYRAATMNGINAEDCLKAAITTLKAEQKDEMRDGIVDVTTACSAYDKAKTLTEKKTIRNKMIKLLAAENYKAFTRAEAMQMVNDYMNGTDVAEKDNDKYIQLSTSSDVRADYRLNAIGKQAKTYADSIKNAAKRGDSQTADRLAQRYGAWLEIDALAKQERSVVNKLKKQLGHGNDKAIMSEIRQARRDFQGQIDQVQPPK